MTATRKTHSQSEHTSTGTYKLTKGQTGQASLALQFRILCLGCHLQNSLAHAQVIMSPDVRGIAHHVTNQKDSGFPIWPTPETPIGTPIGPQAP